MTDAVRDDQEYVSCKICTDGVIDGDPLRRPCRCAGSMRYIHESCLEECMKQSDSCKICKHEFRKRKVYRAGTPARVPLRCVASAVLRQLGMASRDALCLGYLLARVVLVLGINGRLAAEFAVDLSGSGKLWVLLVGAVVLAVTYSHNYTFLSVYRAINSGTRLRMNAPRTIHSMASEVLSRADTELARDPPDDPEVASSFNASLLELRHSLEEDDEIDQNSSTTSLIDEESIFAMARANIFTLPAPRKMLQDLRNVVSLVWLSVLGFVYSRCWPQICTGGQKALSPFGRGLAKVCGAFASYAKQMVPGLQTSEERLAELCARWLAFIQHSSLTRLLRLVHCSIALLSLVVFILHIARSSARSHTLSWIYNCAKLYMSVTVGVYYIWFFMGVIFHFLVCIFINNGIPVFTAKDPLLATIVYITIGVCITKGVRVFNEKLDASFRPGLLFSPYAMQSKSEIIEYIIETSWSSLILSACTNMLIGVLYSLGIVCVIRRHCSPFLINNWRAIFTTIKFAILFYTVAADFGASLAALSDSIIRRLGAAFKANNFLYNAPLHIEDTKRLVWDLNINTRSLWLRKEAVNINSVLQSFPSISAIRDTEDVGPVESNTPNDNESIGSTIRMRRERRLRSDANYSIIKKYSINQKKIDRYYAKKHKGKFSIFYKPKHFWLFKKLARLACIGSSLTIGWGILRLTSLIATAVAPQSTVVFGFTGLYIAKFITFAFSVTRERLLTAPKSLLIALFTDIIMPLLFTLVYYTSACDPSKFISISIIFLFFCSLSSLAHSLYSKLFIASSLENFSYHYLIRHFLSLTFIQCAMILTYSLASRYISIPMLSGILVLMYTIYRASVFIMHLLTGDWLTDIKDRYYLDKIEIEDYVASETIASDNIVAEN